MSEPIVYRFQPERANEFLSGVPARDLTKADVDALEPAQLVNVIASDLYSNVIPKDYKQTEDDE